jgi:acyl-CoA reductase-like NAD-dependent aldehyde dehydrogenase
MSYQTILEEVRLLPPEERLLLLESIFRMMREELIPRAIASQELTATDIRRLPLPERNRILAEAAQAALADYQPGSELIEFTEALAGDDIYEYDEK